MKLITDAELENSLQVDIKGYKFLVQFEKGNNVVMEKYRDSDITVIGAIKMFVEFCRSRGIEYLTVESRNGSGIYYKIAKRYFPLDEYFMDNDVLRIKLISERRK